MRIFRHSLLLLCLLGAIAPVFAQKQLTMNDAFVRRSLLTPVALRQLQWIPGGQYFTYALPDQRVVKTDAATLKTDTLDLLKNINAQLVAEKREELKRLPTFEWIDAGNLWFDEKGHIYRYDLAGKIVSLPGYPSDAESVDYDKKNRAVTYRLNKGLWIADMNDIYEIAHSEYDGIEYGSSVHRDEFGIHKGTFWSPSGKNLAFYRMDESMVTPYGIYQLDSMPATTRKIRYPFAGATSHQVTVGVYNLATRSTIYLQTGEPKEQYLTNVAWTPDDKYILIAVLNREQNHHSLRLYDATTGAFVREILEEKNEKWVEPEAPAQFVPGKNDQFVWQSERDGYNHLYLYDLTGKMIRQLSRGKTPVTQFYGFSNDGKRCFYQIADESGLNRSVLFADLATGQSMCIACESGVHNAVVSPEGNWMIDVFSDAVTPRVVYAQSTQGKMARKTVFTAPNPLTDYQVGKVKMVTLNSKGGFPLNGRLVLPPDYETSGKRYPAIVYVYNGPHAQLIVNNWLSASELWMHRMASEGYVVFTVDGRGSDNRGFAFESDIFRRVGDVEIEDQLTGVQYLSEQTWIDPARIGVFGWSYGGFMATSLMTRPEAKSKFKCGVAGGPVIDWRMYEVMYTERYMDTPQENPEGYRKNSLFQYVDNLEGRLLMIHGSSDPVVLWQHSLRYIRECVERGIQIDYFVYPEREHNVVIPKERAHLFDKIERFFKDNL